MATKKTKYTKVNQIEHILKRPDMYVGSVLPESNEHYVVVDDTFSIQKRQVKISEALLRVFIEPLSNAVDNLARSIQNETKMTYIKVNIDEKTGRTEIINDGDVIPVEMHESEKCYNHTLIFGSLLTSSNYNDEEDRINISGKNGIGVKATCVFSKSFTVEGVDPSTGKSFQQTWKNNMTVVDPPVIKPSKLKKGYTKVIYFPDFEKFKIKGYTPDILNLYKKYIVDTAMLTKLSVYFNDELIPVKTLVDYSKLYKTKYDEDENEDGSPKKEEILNIKTSTCDVVLIPSDGVFEHVAFSNGIYNPRGGVHVDAWSEALFRPILEKINVPKKPQVNINDIKNFFKLFVTVSVNRPVYDSQSKLTLKGPAVLTDVKKKHLDALKKWEFMESIKDIIKTKELLSLKKTERKKRGYTRIEGLEPANFEGGKKGHECTLILVEGLSAKTYVSHGLQNGVFGKKGRDYNGIYPLKGKLLNTRNAKVSSIANNTIITNIIQAIGVNYELDYTLDENYKKLRYGRVLCVCDADTDGIHITSLIQNVFHSLFPTLLQREKSFLTCMQTPIVRVYLGKNKNILFYDEHEYKKYASNQGKKIDKKYFKGLGSSNKDDVLETFGVKIVNFVCDNKTTESMNKAFHLKYANLRKEWLANFNSAEKAIEWNGDKPEEIKVNISDFIDKELIKFSLDDCKRSIPNLIDGLKEGHRKVLFVCFKRNLSYGGKTIKVAQLAGSVGEKSGYKHGEQNLFLTITNMASSYVGSNNIPFLFRDGGFGSREANGKDAANARYIFTKLDALTRLIYRPEDDVLLEYMDDDGSSVEPTFYVPIIPMILVNGCSTGIGTGWSCTIPAYNPLDLIDMIKIWLDNNGKVFIKDDESSTTISLFPEIKPWYRGHKGEMTQEGQRFVSHGIIEDVKQGVIKVTELPVGLSTNDFVENLEKLKEEKKIAKYEDHHTPEIINFTIKEVEDQPCDEKKLKLCTYFRTSNMVLFSNEDGLKKFQNIEEIMDTYCKIRYDFYVKRKVYIIQDLELKIKHTSNKYRFLQEIRDGEFKLFETVQGKRQSRKTNDIVKELVKKKYDKIVKIISEESEDPEDEKNENEDEKGYEYLLKLQINNITFEKIEKLKKELDSLTKDKDALIKTSEKQMWLNDLAELEAKYPMYIQDLEPKGKEIGVKKVTKNKL